MPGSVPKNAAPRGRASAPAIEKEDLSAALGTACEPAARKARSSGSASTSAQGSALLLHRGAPWPPHRGAPWLPHGNCPGANETSTGSSAEHPHGRAPECCTQDRLRTGPRETRRVQGAPERPHRGATCHTTAEGSALAQKRRRPAEPQDASASARWRPRRAGRIPRMSRITSKHEPQQQAKERNVFCFFLFFARTL